MDSTGSGIMHLTGEETEKGKTFTYKGHFFGPGATKIPTTSVLTIVSEDERRMDMTMDMGEADMKMEMTYKRVK
jgi:hypothetical protein